MTYRTTLATQIIERYHTDKRMEPLSPLILRDRVDQFERHFNYNGVPIERIPDVYLEAISKHGNHYLTIDDYLNAWKRLCEHTSADDDAKVLASEKGAKCSFCHGAGMTRKFIPHDAKNPTIGEEIEVECPVHCKVVTAMVVKPKGAL